MGLFKKGFEASREEKARQDEARENAGKKLWRFFLSKPEKGETSTEAELRFLTEEPINFYEHNIKRGDNKFEQYTCSGENCPLCADGDRPVFKGAFLVVDRREFEYTDKDGKKQKGKDQVRLFVQGMKVVSQLDRISTKYGLSNRDVTLVRLGKGTETTYTVEKGDKDVLTTKQIESLLPEKLRDDYDGTTDSLYSIIEEQLMMNTKDYNPDNSYDSEEDTDDDTDDESVIGVEDDEDDEEVRPKKLASNKKLTGKKKMFKKSSEDSRKPRVQGNSRAKKLLNK